GHGGYGGNGTTFNTEARSYGARRGLRRRQVAQGAEDKQPGITRCLSSAPCVTCAAAGRRPAQGRLAVFSVLRAAAPPCSMFSRVLRPLRSSVPVPPSHAPRYT